MLQHVTPVNTSVSLWSCAALFLDAVPFTQFHSISLKFAQVQFRSQLSKQHRNRLNFLNSPRYKASSGALVFGAGSVQWAWGLDNFHDAVTGMNNMWESEHLATCNDHQRSSVIHQ